MLQPILRSLRLKTTGAVKNGRINASMINRLGSIRLQSTDASSTEGPQKLTKEQARGKAQAILEMFPGETLFKKSAYATLFGGAMSFLVSKGIYIPNEETLILVAFLIMSRLAYVKLADPIGSLFQSYINDLRAKMSTAAKDELVQLENEIAMLEEFKDNAAVVDAFFDTRRDNILLEAELAQVQQNLDFMTSIKSKLDDKVRKENERLATEKRVRAEALFKGLLEELKKPKIQEAILKKCLNDLGKMNVPSAQPSL